MYVHSCGTVVASAAEAFAHLVVCAHAGQPVNERHLLWDARDGRGRGRRAARRLGIAL